VPRAREPCRHAGREAAGSQARAGAREGTAGGTTGGTAEGAVGRGGRAGAWGMGPGAARVRARRGGGSPGRGAR
jgi:hypothetical protein